MSAMYAGIRTSERPVFEGFDGAVIAAPAALHYALAVEALNAGVHVLVEKPIALTPKEADELVRLADKRRVILMVDHLLEYHPAVVRLREEIGGERLGDVLHLSSQRLNLGVIRTEENALWSLAPHDISVILYLLGEAPVEVSAHGAAFLQPGIPDLAHVMLRFASGALGHVHVSWLDPIKTRRVVLVGERGMAIFDELAEQKLVIHDKRAEPNERGYVPHHGEKDGVPVEDAEPLLLVAEAFLSSIQSGMAPKADGRDGLRVVRVLDAAQRSMDAGGAPIRLEGER